MLGFSAIGSAPVGGLGIEEVTAYRSVSSNTTFQTFSIAGSKPTGTQDSDTLVAVLSRILPQDMISIPVGWTKQYINGLETDVVDGRVQVYTAKGSVTDFTWNWGGLNTGSVQVMCFKERYGTISASALLTITDTAPFTAPSKTALAGDALMLVFWEWQRITSLSDPIPYATVRSNISLLPDGPTTLIATTDITTSGATETYTMQGVPYYTRYGIQILLPKTSNIGRPTSDLTTTGWTPSVGTVLYEMLNEHVLDTWDYITSPELTTSLDSASFAIADLAPGTYKLRFNAKQTADAAQARLLLKDSVGTVVGTGDWHNLTNDFTTYETAVTTTGTAVSATIEPYITPVVVSTTAPITSLLASF